MKGSWKLKKLSIAIILIILFTSGCYISHQGERPYDYPSAKWVSKNPDVWFIVNSPYTDDIELFGEVNVNGEVIDCAVEFDYTDRVYFGKKDGTGALFEGDCKFGSDKMTVKINKERDFVFDGKYDEITFVKTPIE